MNNISKFGYIKHTLVILTSMVFLFLNIGFFVKVTEAVPNQPQGFDPSRYVEFDGQFDWDDALTPKTESDQYISYSDYRSTICTAGASTCDTTKTIRIETAEELYRFSVDVSFAEVYITGNPTEDVKLSDTKIEELLDQDFVLGQDIDYSVMKSKTFIPIGFLFADTLGNIYQRYFTGTFDGQGFEITNLYLSGHQYLIYEDNNNPESVEIAMTEYYGMFNYNAGLIKNIGFIDMYTEMLQMNTELTKMTNIVGFNMPDPESWNEVEEDFDVYGSVENIYLIDRRVNVEEAGIRYLVGTSSEDFQAAGIVHTNAGNFKNSYVATRVVVNANFIDKFTIEPVVYTNTGSVIINLGEVDQEEIIVTGQSSNLYYDSSIYLTGDIDIDDDQIIDFAVKTPNPLATGISTIDLETGNFTYEPNSFYFYPDDGYPILKGLDYVGGVYQINDALDLALFSKLLNKNTELNGEEFSRSDFILTADIDMSILSPGSYEVPHKIFYGTLSGANGSEDVLTDNFYIYGLDILGGYSVNNEHYVGLFSRLGSGAKISDINFSQSTIAFSNTDDIYSQTFYMGAIAGKMVDATIENVIVDINYNLGNEALSRTYLGGVVGQASGVINKVSNNGDINFGSHTFTETQAINAKYYIGGIAGSALSTDRLSIYDSVNNGNITGFSTSSDIYLSSGVTDINVYIGGITGYLENTTSAIHDLVYVSNKGNINVGSVKERTGVEAYQYSGGVFGTLVGKAPVLEDETGLRFANLYNEGNLIAEYNESSAQIKGAGIGVSNTNEDVEYALLFNHGTFNYDSTDIVQGATDLFISEYGEGYSSNRWIEIYNGTQQVIDLSNYSYGTDLLKNGNWSNVTNLQGSLNPGETYVIVHSSANWTYRTYADLLITLNFSGDDAVGLFKNGQLIDIVGVFGQDPGSGWAVDGAYTYDNVIKRKASVYQPYTIWNPNEWQALGYQNTNSLGTHDAEFNFDSFDYVTTIFDISQNIIDITLSRVYNYGELSYDSPIFYDVSPFYRSTNDNYTKIRFSSNFGNINYSNSSGEEEINLASITNISAITTNTNVDYLNVHNYGHINVLNVNVGLFELYISGFAKQLSVDRYIENSINSGNIIFADISGTGNIYVSGLVNFNFAGDLQESTQPVNQPIATEGIINSINAGNISTTSNSSIYGVNGLNNTFVGGLVTANAGSIQDSANIADISLVNTNELGETSFAESTAAAYEGGLILKFSTGIVAGGVSGFVLDGNSRIYDSSNNGDVLVKTNRFSRAGGVLGTALYRESIAGGINSSMGLVDNVQNSKLANGLNFGDVSALTKVIEEYSTTPVTRDLDLVIGDNPNINYSRYRLVPLTYSDTLGSEQRLPVYAVAGGVIGYGLSYMNNMLNHGTISSTDVAGGVVGATYVLGGSNNPITIVNITTAVNYGHIKSIDIESINEIDLPSNNFTITYVENEYMPDNNSFIYPSGYTREGPRGKRGFGGIFGRLQRGNLGVMTSSGGSFNFIVNANPNIDLIGRIDQVGDFSNTVTAYRFNGAIYYSAKRNDTTQVVFSGFNYTQEYFYSGSNRDAVFETISVTYLGYQQDGANYNHKYSIIREYYNGYSQQGIINDPETVYQYIDELITTSTSTQPASTYTVGQINYIDNNDRYYYVGGRVIPWITENPNDFYITDSDNQYMYDESFPMRTEPDLTEYIYFAEYDLLADRFRKVEDEGLGTNIRENGMYVLSTTAGQEFGEVLPRNINPSAIELINEDLDLTINNVDYGNLAPSETINLSETIIDKYEALYQTRYNDKAELTDSELQNITLHENNGGSNTVLSSPEINYATKEITYTISMEAFDSLQETASFNIFDALTSANALIAVRPEDYYPTDELIISEYIEGSSNNKSIEIYNGTKSDIDLSAYSIEIYYNGSTSPGNTIYLSGTLLSGHTYVVSNNSADTEILALSDLITGLVQHNGNDAVALLKNGVAIDVFGVIGVDPGTGWDVDGITGQDTADHTLVRKPTVSSPNTTFTGSEWIIYDVDTFDYLGMHNLDVISDYLYPERYDEISSLYPPLLEVDLPAYNISSDTTLSLGYFSIYSEAFVNNSIFAKNMYYNNYHIEIIFTPNMNETTGTSGIQSVSFNGGASINLSTTTEYIDPQPLSIDITGRGNVNYNGSLTLNFNDQKSFLNEGYDFKEFFKLYYLDGTNEVEVDASYYSISSTPVAAGGLYQIVFVFDDALLKAGNYIIKYSYFSASTEYEVLFDKAPSNQVAVIDFDYYSMNDHITFNGTSITSYINMGKIPDIDTTTNNYTTNTMEISNPLYEVFLSTTTYDISFMYSDSFMISPFAEVTRAQLINTTYSGGYVTYIIEYDITAEDGVTEETYTHTIVERAVSLTAAYKDGNDVPLENITTTREALTTRFEIDLGFDTSIDMSGPVEYSVNTSDPAYLEISVSGIEPKEDPLDPDVPITNIVGLTYSANNYLIIDMSAETLPGTYTFIITYNRGTTIGNIVFASLEITKLEGTSAYISDIKFTPIASESTYPTIDIVDSFGGDITQIYDPSIYFFGIDYDGADDNYYQYFKINGKVNNIPLESYYPYILDYLPLGATISRWDTTTSDWTAGVSASSTDLEKSVLAADYTEIVGNENIAIKYRVKSEDGNSEVYYYISVNDILYNVTLIFDIYYCDDQEVCVLAKSTEDFTEVIQINVYNLYIDSNDMSEVNPAYSENNPLYYRTFSKVSGLYNSMSHYIYTDSTNYNYRFGRNRSGFYIFEVILPIDEYLNEMYTYEIMIDGYTLDDLDDLTYTSNIDLNGKYYYIDYSENNRTRRFDIKISRTTVSGDKPFGLFDYFRTWS